ncbi:tight adherence pilus pseudopilin TadF, partial [Vibrio harveyi]|uniref:tight adherence pilus pseudopilin TadF n=1 Tax=Vibrio harveyi TaxID=669 RepID=UPI0028BF20F5
MRNVKGVFTMELAMVLVFVASLFVIQVNSTVAVSNRGKLQRISYSLATILSERKELFNDEGHMCKSEANCKEALRMLYSIAKASMSRMSGEFKPQKLGLQIEELRKTKSHFLHSKRSIGDIRAVSYTHLTLPTTFVM